MRTFVMGDIHGAWKAVKQCLERSEFDYRTDELIQLGDITDGHSQVYECVEELLRLEHLVAIRGNHDEWFRLYLHRGYHPDGWRQGGYATARSYLRPFGKEDLVVKGLSGYETALNTGDIPDSHKRFFDHQVLYYVDGEQNCFVHAGFDRELPFYGQREEVYLWDRSLWQKALSFKASSRGSNENSRFYCRTPFHKIFIGHTPTLAWKTDQPMQAGQIHNLDTGAGSSGRLTIMCLASQQYWQSDSLSDLYPEG